MDFKTTKSILNSIFPESSISKHAITAAYQKHLDMKGITLILCVHNLLQFIVIGLKLFETELCAAPSIQKQAQYTYVHIEYTVKITDVQYCLHLNSMHFHFSCHYGKHERILQKEFLFERNTYLFKLIKRVTNEGITFILHKYL